MLVEDTPEHRRFFGEDGRHVRYFRDIESMLLAARDLLKTPAERTRMRASMLSLMRREDHTYSARLRTMLEFAGIPPGGGP